MELSFLAGETPLSSLFQTGRIQDVFDSFSQSGHIFASGRCKMRLTASATLYQFSSLFHQFAGIQAFSHQRLAQHNHQRAFLTVFDSCHKEDLFVRIAFAFDLESQVFDSIDIGLPPEYDDFHAVTLNRFGNQIFLQLLDFFFQIIAYLFFQFGILFDGLTPSIRAICIHRRAASL